MQIWMTLILAVQLLSAFVMIGLVLIQHGKGADMGASFGSGASGSLFGASGSANFLSRSTAACATVFFVCTLALAYLGNANSNRSGGDSGLGGASVLDRPAGSSSAASAPGAGAVPGAVPSAAPVPAPVAAPVPAQAAASAVAPGASK